MAKNVDIKLNIQARGAKKELKEVDKGLSGIGKSGKGASTGLKGIGGASKIAGKGFNVLGGAMKAAGIGIIVAILAKLMEAFSGNQKIMDAVNRIMLKMQPIFDMVTAAVEILAEVVEFVVTVFTDFIGALFGASSASNDFASSLVEQRKKVKLLEAELGLLQLQYQKEAELMRQIRDDESLSIDERIQANLELGKVLAEQVQHERSIAEQSLLLAEMELSVNKENIDLQVEVINAKTKLAEIDERITGQRSEQLVNLNSLERERDAQNKEAAAKREEQLAKEAEMLQNLIDLQNEDIKVTKKKFRTINEQFDNAEKQNKAQIKELERKKKAELENLKLQTKNAQTNIDIKGEELSTFKSTNEQLIKSNKEKADSFARIAQEELRKVGFINVEHIKTQEDLAEFQKSHMEGIGEEVKLVAKEFGYSVQELYDDSFTFDAVLSTARGMVSSTIDNATTAFSNATSSIKELTKTQSEEIIAITEDQITHTEGIINESVKFVENAKSKEAAIIAKYDQEIADTKESLNETTETLQEQADDELFLHFETEKEKEIRLATEKYDILLGLALNNAEQTELLEQEKEDALREIREREGKERIAKMKEWWKKMAEEKKKQDKLDELAAENKKKMQIDAAQQSLAMGVGLAKKGTAAYKALASAETIMATYSAATKALDDVPTPWNFIQAGLIIATGMKNLAEISKTKVEGGGTETMPDTISGGGDMGGDVPALPTFGAIGTEPPPIQAYVVESDVSDAQALQGELDLQSTL